MLFITNLCNATQVSLMCLKDLFLCLLRYNLFCSFSWWIKFIHSQIFLCDAYASIRIYRAIFPRIFCVDQFPIKFYSLVSGWCERLIDSQTDSRNQLFEFVPSPGPTPQPESSPAVKIFEYWIDQLHRMSLWSLKKQIWDQLAMSPNSITIMQGVKKRISANRGAALIVDYCHDHSSSFSLRGIRNHKFVDALKEHVDIDLVSAHSRVSILLGVTFFFLS